MMSIHYCYEYLDLLNDQQIKYTQNPIFIYSFDPVPARVKNSNAHNYYYYDY